MMLTSLERFCLDRDLRTERGEEVHVEALRALSAAAGEHRVEIGGVQTVFWSGDPLGDAFLSGASGPSPTTGARLPGQAQGCLRRIDRRRAIRIESLCRPLLDLTHQGRGPGVRAAP